MVQQEQMARVGECRSREKASGAFVCLHQRSTSSRNSASPAQTSTRNDVALVGGHVR